MGLDYFRGYETMIFIVALFLYGLVPWGAMWLMMKYAPGRRYILAVPVISLTAVYVFQAIFTFVFSEAEMERVFQGRLQLLMLSAIFMLWGLWRQRERIRAKPALLWGITAVCGLLAGVAARLCLFMALIFSFSSFGRRTARFPHSGPAAGVLTILTVLCWGGALAATASLHDKENRNNGCMLFGLLSMASFIGIKILILGW